MPEDKQEQKDRRSYTATRLSNSYSPTIPQHALPPPPPSIQRASGANFLQPPYFLPQQELEYAARANIFARPPPPPATTQDSPTSTEMVELNVPGVRYIVETKNPLKKHAVFRVRPWALISSIIFLLIGAGMIACTFASFGTSRSLWGILTGGVSYTLASFVGIAAAITLRPTLAFLAFLSTSTSWASTLAVVIVNATSLNSYTLTQCIVAGASRFSPTCENIREYHFIVFTLFGVLTALWVPTLVVTMGFLWRLCDSYWKEQYSPTPP